MGVYSKNHFGTVSGGFVSQIALPVVGNSYSYGKSPIIDSVLLTIPYAVSKDKDKKYVLDSIYGNKDIPFKINVHEVKTFLNSLNPEKPSEAMIYKSNKKTKTLLRKKLLYTVEAFRLIKTTPLLI